MAKIDYGVEFGERALHLGIDVERLETVAPAPFVARDDELANLALEAGIVRRRLRGREQLRDLGIDVERGLAAADEPRAAGAEHLADFGLLLGERARLRRTSRVAASRTGRSRR